jgi:hypothetical protein
MCFPLGDDGTDPVDDTISAEDYLAGFQQLSEDLSSSPSGCHLENYKAGLDDLELCTMYATVISIPFRHGITLRRWTSAVQMMLEKTKRCAQIDKL